MKKIITLISLSLIGFTSCKKEPNVCYECKDQSGNFLNEVCGKDEQDAFNKSGIIEGVHNINKFRERCHKK